ncbi:helix-hairpin-helix domain-containing protein [Arthrobacter sp.]|uniref:helix-hairpin-helix domain-containing protein n=1 Tax=Arthrobacter sp. TaxID=1667 RepID=UPI003A8DBB63
MVRHRWELRTDPTPGRAGGVRFRFRMGRGAIMCLLFTAVIWIAASLLFHPPEGAGERLGAVQMDPSAATGTTTAQPSPAATPGTGSAQPSTPAPETAAGQTPAEIVVHVAGAVKRPGVYHFASGQRAGDAVRKAGGLTARAVASAVNLAAPLQDGEQLYLPTQDEVASSATAPGAAAPSAAAADGGGGGALDINTASATELEQLPGIGPALSARIVEFRTSNGPYASLDELDAVPGIGPAMMARLEPLVRFR